MPSASWILGEVRHDIESIFVEQRAILCSIQAPMIEGLAFVLSEYLSMHRSGGKHQRCFGCGVATEYGEHNSLIFRAEMEKTVPSQNAIKTLAQR